MRDSKCNLNEIFIEQFADGELDLKESSEISAHLENCSECREKYKEIRFVKSLISQVKKQDVLSVIEKEGFLSLIDHHSKPSLLSKIKTLVLSHAFAVGFSFISFVSFLLVFSYYISTSDKQNRLIVNEILSAHQHTFPDEFSGSEKTEAELEKNFKVDKKLMKKLVELSPVVRGRYTTIAATPAAKIHLENTADGKGTLFMAQKNEHLKKLFAGKNCVVKTNDKGCTVRGFHEKDNDLVYWGNNDNDYVFVTDNHGMMAQMVQLISSDY